MYSNSKFMGLRPPKGAVRRQDETSLSSGHAYPTFGWDVSGATRAQRNMRPSFGECCRAHGEPQHVARQEGPHVRGHLRMRVLRHHLHAALPLEAVLHDLRSQHMEAPRGPHALGSLL